MRGRGTWGSRRRGRLEERKSCWRMGAASHSPQQGRGRIHGCVERRVETWEAEILMLLFVFMTDD